MKNREQHNVGIGKRIREARLNAKLKGIEVSAKMGLSRSMCSQWERGIANPATAHLVKLAKILDVSFEYLAIGETKSIEQSTDTIQNQDFHHLFNQLNPVQQKYLTKFIATVV